MKKKNIYDGWYVRYTDEKGVSNCVWYSSLVEIESFVKSKGLSMFDYDILDPREVHNKY